MESVCLNFRGLKWSLVMFSHHMFHYLNLELWKQRLFFFQKKNTVFILF
jgi:hypothetical protein